MAIHEGNSNRRLASQANKILLLPISEVPEKFKPSYNSLISLIEQTMDKIHVPGLMPVRLDSIQNKTAAKYLNFFLKLKTK